MRTLLAIAALVVASIAGARVCTSLEVAELNSMKTQELVALYCEYRDVQGEQHSADLTHESLKNAEDQRFKCAEEQKRIQRVLKGPNVEYPWNGCATGQGK